ncbi:elongation of very long chain fatty acids protein AAEL008004-like [Diprion similis]|uniref:elongation of very long chain fatty acids protein AAEL008004-like n=1 Tax=Diprion similis TaxID=362088 RepID=UPI001EF775CF|nr:elongation of very long chain fatty acids protein AAEL008004-like [Diprion similis]XP_046735166.1 elongation of very long chain fatty acids protein AAEL008004-like [Diprion similis]
MLSDVLEWLLPVYKNSDPRTTDWFLVSQPGCIFTIVIAYVYICTSAGPKYMEDKQPYTLRKTLIAYNLFQILLSAYLFKEGIIAYGMNNYSYWCQPIEYSDTPAAMRMATATHLYFICKLIDLLDTVFFVLRKKNRQISFLHVYHHASMVVFAWIGVRYFASGHPTFLGLMNCFVHTFMYSYYLLAAFGAEIQKYLVHWKKYLTLLQIVQFIIVGLHSGQVLFTDCHKVPSLLAILIVLNSSFFVYMFSSFYVHNYFEPNVKSAKTVTGFPNNSMIRKTE